MLRISKAFVVSVIFLIFVLDAQHKTTVAQSPIHFGPTEIQNDFPHSLTFQVTASSDEGDITKAELFYAAGNEISSVSFTSESIEFEPGPKVELTYTWDTSDSTAVPSTPILFYWQVFDSAGNQAQSEEIFVRYEDIRFNWQLLETEDVGVWWHDRPESFGKRVFAIAQAAVDQQSDLFQSELDYQIVIIIYNDAEEFNAWQGLSFDWVGGQAYPNYGITTQIVPASRLQNQWLRGVIPHEISHLYLAQVTYSLLSSVPAWFNEGVAQYNELDDNELALNSAMSAARRGELISLSSLASGFGRHNEERLRLAYDEAFSAVLYIVDQYGGQSLVDLMTAYRQGLTTDDAMLQVFGKSMGEFETEWANWLGAPEDSFVTPTPWPLPTFLPSPTPWIVTNSTPDSPSDISPTPPEIVAQVTSTTLPTPSAKSENAIDADVTPEPPEAKPAVLEQDTAKNSGLCAFVPLLILGTIGFYGPGRRRFWR